jgi:hypothetical protein
VGQLPRQRKLGISHRDAGPPERENVPVLTIHEPRVIDLSTDGCQVRHVSPS